VLTRYGIREWLGITVLAAIPAVILSLLGFWWTAIPIGVIWLALLSFFRDPPRRPPADLGRWDYLSPADGTVSAVEQLPHHDAVGGPALLIRIFLSVLNVHVNRAPIDGVVESITHRPGTYFDARTPESAQQNESNLVVLGIATGERIGLRQVAGKVARRIVCRLAIGDEVRRGQKFGMIKFGSTAELILPQPAHSRVKVGDRVAGGRTVLAFMER
jgi:phosphatidylserine decarboxylase